MSDIEKAKLLLRVVLKRFTSPIRDESNVAIITAIEGLRWIIGDEPSVVDDKWLTFYLEQHRK